MKQIKALIKRKNWLLLGLLSFLGFNTACDDNNSGSVCEYGTPHAIFKIKGQVVNLNKTPIKGIKIVTDITEQAYFFKDSILTDQEGRFNFQIGDFPRETNSFVLITSDIDGSENGGEFVADTTIVNFNSSELSGGDGRWNHGSVEKSVEIILNKKSDE